MDARRLGNAVATATFQGLSDRLVIDSVAELQLDAAAWPVFDIAPPPSPTGSLFRADDWIILAPGGGAISRSQGTVARLGPALRARQADDTLALLRDLSTGITGWIPYQSREDEGTQSPVETLERGWGSCRDFAVLFVEAARSLGFGARIVSGYLYNPEREREAGTTHAWAEVFVPGRAGSPSIRPTAASAAST